jgi:hypothetical protein
MLEHYQSCLSSYQLDAAQWAATGKGAQQQQALHTRLQTTPMSPASTCSPININSWLTMTTARLVSGLTAWKAGRDSAEERMANAIVATAAHDKCKGEGPETRRRDETPLLAGKQDGLNSGSLCSTTERP